MTSALDWKGLTPKVLGFFLIFIDLLWEWVMKLSLIATLMKFSLILSLSADA